MPRVGEYENLEGQRFGKLTVVRMHEVITRKTKKRIRRYMVWECSCECGNTCYVRSIDLKSGKTISCGCYMEQARKNGLHTTHGLSKTRLYRLYTSMRTRCYNRSDSHYDNYGGRGITICDEWLEDFASFYNWAIENGYEEGKGLSIDRIDVNKGYSPDNCRFITMHEQHFNKTTTHYIEVDGEILAIAEAAEKYDVNPKTVYSRVYRGQTPIKEEEK